MTSENHNDLVTRLDERYRVITETLNAMNASNTQTIQTLTSTTVQLTRTVALLEQRVSNHEHTNAEREREVDRRIAELKQADEQNATEHQQFISTLDGLRELVNRASGGFRVVMWGLGFLLSFTVSLLLYFLTQYTHVPK